MTKRIYGVMALVLVAIPAHGQDDIAHGKRVFQVCASCHAADAETNRFGPHLKGIVGRRAGVVADFRYSQALRDAGANGLIWDDAALEAFLYSPRTKVPGTSMRFWGLWSQAEIRDVIAYLRSTP